MYLKSIVMQGFKSFAHKIDLQFHDGITCIVGPNGSGKSNVADAVRWVLGEQSAKQLRGGNMQDVIFSGTETRKPLGFASVAITFDNQDHVLAIDAEEVTVTRRLFRSGESEYLLNGRACRLRDINELFFDTGIGKEGYSIIGQGQIDRILSGKPDERRELFDEAAGIVKFKRRKAASVKKLDAEEQNLVRVTDILSELERQVGPLSRQAEKAEQYLAMREELKKVDLTYFCGEAARVGDQIDELKEKISIAADQKSALEEDFARTKAEYAEIEEMRTKIEETIGGLREQSAADQLAKQQTEGEISVLEEQIRSAKRNRDLYQERVDAIDEQIARIEAERAGQTEDKARQQSELSELEKQRDEAQVAVEKLQATIEEITRSTEESRSSTIDLLNQRSAIREKMQRYDTMREQTELRRAEIASSLLAIQGDEQAQKEAYEQCKSAYEKATAKGEAVAAQLTETEEEIARSKETLDALNQQLETEQGEYHRDSSRLESLRELAERYEGYGNSVRRIMERRADNPGVHGVVAELIRTGKRYETAIETSLGGALQNVVTDNENTAKYMIEFLKKGHFGRATFLPLTTVQPREAFEHPKALDETGAIGLADTLVECDALYRDVVSRLLGATLVVDTIDHAIAIGRKYKHKIRMVTLEGELLNQGGSMTGGAFKSKSNLLGRSREIEELEKRVRALKQSLKEAQETIDETRKQRTKLRELEHELQGDLQKHYLAQNTAKLNMEAAGERLTELKEQTEKLSAERGELASQIEEIEAAKALVAEELVASEKEEGRLQGVVKEAGEQIERLHEQEEEAREALGEAQLIYAERKQAVDFIDERLAASAGELTRLSEEKLGLAENMESQHGDVKERKTQIEALRARIGELEAAILGAEESVGDALAQKEELNRTHKAFFSKRDELSLALGELDKESFRLDTRLERLQESFDAQVEYLQESYHITPDEAKADEAYASLSQTELRKRGNALKRDIRELGDVNVNAIEEYKEVGKRYAFLKEQHADLIRAADTLRGIIKKLDEGMRRQFREKFEEIRVEYDKVFRELFGGGKGSLELVEGEDILDAGITISAQPPGKKLQNMMQLSGGEKSLSAIALLFAIQNLKPSPFCLLDEIEAALDDSNVVRYAEYLHKLTKNIQFIIITHRRGTMATADRLYGITMQEKGVSALVSVKLIESELD